MLIKKIHHTHTHKDRLENIFLAKITLKMDCLNRPILANKTFYPIPILSTFNTLSTLHYATFKLVNVKTHYHPVYFR